MVTTLVAVREASEMYEQKFRMAGRERVALNIGPRWNPIAKIRAAVVTFVAAVTERLHEQTGMAHTA